ncbi:MAG: hypothetical protein FWF58_03875, partial [Firmicutes bacterium]|nr:hypothetical protein [Bacillota bacterium]
DGLLLEELVSLKSTIKDMSVPTATLDTQALNDILSAIKQEVGQLSQNSTDSQAIEELKVDIQELVQRLNTNTADQNAQGLADIKKQLNQLKDITNKIVANNEFVNDFAEQFELLQKELREVKKIKEEPDYSALNEIMQVRNEFDAIKTQLSKLADNAIDNSQIQDDNQNIVKELQAIKRDIFNVSMANVGDNGVDEFENYNQILFDEITRLSEQIQEIKTVDQNRSIDEILQEISDVKRTISENNQQLFANDSELDSKLDRLRDELVQLLNDKE